MTSTNTPALSSKHCYTPYPDSSFKIVSKMYIAKLYRPTYDNSF